MFFLFDIKGRLIKNFVNQEDGQCRQIKIPIGLPNGVYFLKIESQNNFEVRKILILK